MDILQMVGILDLIFIVILAVSTLLGLIRGVIREVLSLVGLVASVYLAFKFSDALSKTYTSQVFEDSRISYIVTFVLIIVATLFAVTLVNLFFSQLLRASGLSFVNRFFGMVFGVLRGTLICSILVLVIGFVPGITSEKWWKDSSLAPIFKNITKTSLKYLPDEVASYFESAKDSVGKAAGEILPSGSLRPSKGTSNATNATPTNSTAGNNTENAGSNEQMQLILQSIDDSRQASTQDGQQGTASNAQPQTSTPQKSELILESSQEQ